jgi:hypothetical protein
MVKANTTLPTIRECILDDPAPLEKEVADEIIYNCQSYVDLWTGKTVGLSKEEGRQIIARALMRAVGDWWVVEGEA